MHVTGIVLEPQISIDGKLRLVFEIEEKRKALTEIEKLFNKKLVIDVTKFFKKRSGQANKYLWELIGKIADELGEDKWIVYLKMITEAGVFYDVDIATESVEGFSRQYRYVRVLDTFPIVDELTGAEKEVSTVRCYYGSSSYNSKEFSRLLNHVIEEAHSLDIETITDAELQMLIESVGDYYGGKSVQTAY